MAKIKYIVEGKGELIFEVDEQLAVQYAEIERETLREEWRNEWRNRKKMISIEILADRGIFLLSEEPLPDTVCIQKELKKALYEAIDALSIDQKHILHRHYIEGVSKIQLAKEFGVTEGAIRSRLSTIYKILKRLLRGSYDLGDLTL